MEKILNSATTEIEAASFRDPSGFVFWEDGVPYRQVNRCFSDDYEVLMRSGLCDELAARGALIAHSEEDMSHKKSDQAYKIIKPEKVPFLCYPYEWCFSQLKDAALLTLEIQKKALDRGMSLKDASAFNVQFRGCAPVFIDTLSFERYKEGRPWIAYRQFCQHFLLPLALICRTNPQCARLSATHLDGIPLALGSQMLPLRTYLSPGLVLHVHLHRWFQQHRSTAATNPKKASGLSKFAFYALIDSLNSIVSRLRLPKQQSIWDSYYAETNYSDEAMQAKEQLVQRYLDQLQPKMVWDLGANVGRFSRLATQRGALTVALEADHACVEANYLEGKQSNNRLLIPLVADLTNPTPALGWQNEERKSLMQRGPADVGFCLALIHHLAIGANVPLPRIAAYLSTICRALIIEFVPKEDSQVQRLFASREDIFPDYNRDAFEAAMQQNFQILAQEQISGTTRWLYLCTRRGV